MSKIIRIFAVEKDEIVRLINFKTSKIMLMSFPTFKKACTELVATCERCDYSYEIGMSSDKVAFMRIFAQPDRMLLPSVLFRAIPSDFLFFVSWDGLKKVPYIYIYPNELDL